MTHARQKFKNFTRGLDQARTKHMPTNMNGKSSKESNDRNRATEKNDGVKSIQYNLTICGRHPHQLTAQKPLLLASASTADEKGRVGRSRRPGHWHLAPRRRRLPGGSSRRQCALV
jgi:hypothetical protein